MLSIYTEDHNLAEATQVYHAGLTLHYTRRQTVEMGVFCTSLLPISAAVGTTGAGPCLIIVVHTRQKTGALGHFPGDPEPSNVVRGVASMVTALGNVPIECILFSAGIAGGDSQSKYQSRICGTCQNVYPKASIEWPVQAADDPYGACVYMPFEEKAALFHQMPGRFGTFGEPGKGLKLHPYPDQ